MLFWSIFIWKSRAEPTQSASGNPLSATCMHVTSVKQSEIGEKKLQGYRKAPPCCSVTQDFGKSSTFSDCVPETAKQFFTLSCTDTACLDQEVLCAVSNMCLKVVQFELANQNRRAAQHTGGWDQDTFQSRFLLSNNYFLSFKKQHENRLCCSSESQ